MRIQDTDRILKESRINRNQLANEPEHGLMSRAWNMVTHLPGRITSLFSRKH